VFCDLDQDTQPYLYYR